MSTTTTRQLIHYGKKGKGGSSASTRPYVIQMRRDAIKYTPMAAAEVAETPISAYSNTNCTTGVTTHIVHDNATLTFPATMLLVLQGNAYTYATSIIQGSGPGYVDLKNPVEVDITDHRVNGSQGQLISFWENGMHPWATGYQAISDYARLQTMAAGYDGSSGGKPDIRTGKHCMLGDSWFANGYIANYLGSWWTAATWINAGVNANKGDQMIARFSTDVAAYSPNYVWLMDGSNDAAAGYTGATYQSNLQTLVGLIQGINALPLLFTPAQGWDAPSIALLNDYESRMLSLYG